MRKKFVLDIIRECFKEFTNNTLKAISNPNYRGFLDNIYATHDFVNGRRPFAVPVKNGSENYKCQCANAQDKKYGAIIFGHLVR